MFWDFDIECLFIPLCWGAHQDQLLLQIGPHSSYIAGIAPIVINGDGGLLYAHTASTAPKEEHCI